MPVILLVRHGQASYGAADYDVLSPVGEEQATVTGAELARRGLSTPVLQAGTLRRQRDTARLLGLGDDIAVDGRWDEYDHLALVQRYPSGLPDDGTSRGMQPVLDAALHAWTQDADGGWTAFRDGATAALQDVAATGRDTVVVTSGGIVAALAGVLLHLGPDGIVAVNRVLANGGITKIVVGRAGASLVTVNEHAHLEDGGRRLLTYR